MGLRGSGAMLSFRQSDSVGESLEELSNTLPRSCGDDMSSEGKKNDSVATVAGAASHVSIYTLSIHDKQWPCMVAQNLGA